MIIYSQFLCVLDSDLNFLISMTFIRISPSYYLFNITAREFWIVSNSLRNHCIEHIHVWRKMSYFHHELHLKCFTKITRLTQNRSGFEVSCIWSGLSEIFLKLRKITKFVYFYSFYTMMIHTEMKNLNLIEILLGGQKYSIEIKINDH